MSQGGGKEGRKVRPRMHQDDHIVVVVVVVGDRADATRKTMDNTHTRGCVINLHVDECVFDMN